MRYAILAASMSLLGGCGGSLQLADDAGDGRACPSVRPYEQGFRATLAAELEHLPANSPVRAAMADYWVMRAEALACQSHQ